MKHQLLITQAEADRRLKTTGWSEQTRLIAIKQMEKVLDGCREKVRSRDVAKIIAEVENISDRATSTIRPIKQSQRDRVDFSALKRRSTATI